MQKIPMTVEGEAALRIELEKLKKEDRPTVIQAIAEAREHGDLKENAEYHAAKEKQGFIEARIADLEDKLGRAQVISQPPANLDMVGFGAWVTLSDEETLAEKKYRIVGEIEADIAKNKLSLASPIAKALIGKKLNALVEVKVPKGTIEYSIIKIEY